MSAVTGSFLSRELCGRVVQEIERDGVWRWGEINRGGRSRVDPNVRRAQWCLVPSSCDPLIGGRLLAVTRSLRSVFGPVHSVEGPNLLRYRAGDFFRPHPDEDPQKQVRPRTATIIAFLNDTGFGGGSLRLHRTGGRQPLTIAPSAGRYVAFPASTVHEVTAIDGGSRYALVAWLH